MSARKVMAGWRAVVLLSLFTGGVATGLARSPEPANLFPHKQEIRNYIASGAYLDAITTVASEAGAWIEARARLELRDRSQAAVPSRRLALVLDLDETLISNLPSMLKLDFGYVPDVWQAWVQQAEAPAIEPVRALFQNARRLHLAVIILSSRRESERSATARNLKAIGCSDYAELILQPDDSHATSGVFKREERLQLARAGYVLIANVGDQESDFLEGGSERDFKLPNPFYVTE